MSIFNLFRKSKPQEQEQEQEQDAEGCLFGLTPPEGCHFRVSDLHGGSWHVRIVRGSENVVHECVLTSQFHDKDDHEAMIVAAARLALKAYDRRMAIRHLEGCYPPKRVARG